MATLIKLFGNDIKANQVELNELDNRQVKREFFIVNNVYGSPNATDGCEGEWKAEKIQIQITDNNTITNRLTWAVTFIPKGKDKAVDCLTKSFLLSKGRYDADNKHVSAKGSVREWADTNIVSGILEKEWCQKLATLLNEKGLKVEHEDYPCKSKKGNLFTATISHPYFAK